LEGDEFMNKSERSIVVKQILKYSKFTEEQLEPEPDKKLLNMLNDLMADEATAATVLGTAGVDESDMKAVAEVSYGCTIDFNAMLPEAAFIKDRGQIFVRLKDLYDLAYTKIGIKNLDSIVIQSPTKENGGVAVLTVRVAFNDGTSVACSADAHPGNINEQFKKYPTAIAESRALSRVLIKKMNIKYNAIEETDAATPDISDNPIVDSQKVVLDKLLGDRQITWETCRKEILDSVYDGVEVDDLKHKDVIALFEAIQKIKINKG
jgi:hypothetical protein